MSVRDHRIGRVKPNRRLPEFVRKAGPHRPKFGKRDSVRAAVRRAIQEEWQS